MSEKKEEKRRIKEQKQAAGKRREKLVSLTVKLAAVILVPLVVFVLYQGLRTSAQAPLPDEVIEGDHVRGEVDAPVTLTMYADFQCPACAQEADLLLRAWPRIRGNVRLVFRHYPLDIHQHAFLAARYAEAAGKQGYFWAMHDLLFANQAYWSAGGSASEFFDAYVADLGLDEEKFRQDLQSEEVREKIVLDQRGGIRAGVRSTPTLFVNGRQVSNPRSVSELLVLVNRALE